MMQSPIIHHVLLRDLTPGETYYYSVGRCRPQADKHNCIPPAIVCGEEAEGLG